MNEQRDGGNAFPPHGPGNRGMTTRAWLVGQCLVGCAKNWPPVQLDGSDAMQAVVGTVALAVAIADEAIKQLGQESC